MIKGIMFDFDGTIVDSEVSRFMSINYVLEDYRLELSRKEWDEKYKSLGTKEILDKIKEENDLSYNSDEQYEVSHGYRERYEKENGVPVIDGFKEFYDGVKKKGVKIIVCSGGKTDHFKMVSGLNGLELDGFGREAYDKRKPEPDCFEEGLKRLGLGKDECLIIEDSKTGVLAANKLGVKVIVVNCTEDLAGLDVHAKYENFTDIDISSLDL